MPHTVVIYGRIRALSAAPPTYGGCVVIAGVEWIPTGQACADLGVSRETLRNWYAPRDGRPVLVRLLRDPAGEPVRLGKEYLIARGDAVEAEYRARTEPAGRPRARRAPGQWPA